MLLALAYSSSVFDGRGLTAWRPALPPLSLWCIIGASHGLHIRQHVLKASGSSKWTKQFSAQRDGWRARDASDPCGSFAAPDLASIFAAAFARRRSADASTEVPDRPATPAPAPAPAPARRQRHAGNGTGTGTGGFNPPKSSYNRPGGSGP